MERDNKIPVIYAANNAYVSYLGVSIVSLISNAGAKTQYEIFVLHTDIDENNSKRLEALSIDNIKVSVLNIAYITEKLRLRTSKHLSAEAFYRILAPEVLTQYKKAVYLDCDTVVLEDVARLYDTDLNGFPLAAARHIRDPYIKNYSEEILGLNSFIYFNSGVLVIDMQEFRRSELTQKCYEILQQDRNLTYLDQDALNLASAGNIKYLEDRWNVCWQFQWSQPLPEDKCRYENSLKNPALLHYTSGRKPWKAPQSSLAEYFWNYARCSVFYEEILFKNAQEFSKGYQCFENYEFPYQEVPGNSKIILYGAGGVGMAFWEQMQYTRYCKVVLWTDKKFAEKQKRYSEIKAPEHIGKISWDYIIIAMEDKNRAEKIKAELEKQGIDKERLVWKNPIKQNFG